MSAIYTEQEEMREFRAEWNKTAAGRRRLKMPVITGSFEGEDISDYCHSPVELGWIRNIKFDHQFVGREALEKEVASPRRKIVSLEYDSDDIIDIFASQFRDADPYEFMNIPIQFKTETRHDKVLRNGKLVGVATHPAFSFYYQKSITLAYLDCDCLEPGTKVDVMWGIPGKRQKKIRATVARAPYKPDTRKVDLNTLPKKLDFSKVPDLKEAN
jgi:vanillate/3-O-methylgallate O-demethylase